MHAIVSPKNVKICGRVVASHVNVFRPEVRRRSGKVARVTLLNEEKCARCRMSGLFDEENSYGPIGNVYVQSGASGHSLGFEDEPWGVPPGWWAAIVATYCPSRPGELPNFLFTKPSE